MMKIFKTASHLDYAIIGYFGKIDSLSSGDEVDVIIKESDYFHWVAILCQAGFLNRGAVNLSKSTFMFINLVDGIRIHIHLKFCMNIAKKEYYVRGSRFILNNKIKCPVNGTYHVDRDWEATCYNISVFKQLKRLGIVKFMQKDLNNTANKYHQINPQNPRGKLSYLSRAYQGYKNIKPFNSTSRFVHNAFHIAIIGCDGSGKSSTSKLLTDKLNQVTDAECVYFGLNRGYMSLFLNKMARLFSPNYLNISIIHNLILAIYWLNIARIRAKLFRHCQQQNLRGKITISDRYPIDFFWDMHIPMDGPRINTLNLPAVIKNNISKLELNMYKSILKPKVIFILDAPLEVLYERHSDSGENLEYKYTAIQNLVKSDTYKSFRTDSSDIKETVNEMLKFIKKNIDV